MFKSPAIKLIAGVIFIVLVVVATFAYGRSQREAAIETSPTTVASVSSSSDSTDTTTVTPSSNPTTTVVPDAAPQTGTGQATITPPPPAAAPASTPAKTSDSEAPTTTPETGSGLEYVLPLAILSTLFAIYRKAVKQNI